MTGWRMGYVCAPTPLARQMLKIHQYAIMCAPTTSQYSAIEALQNGDVDIEKMKQEYDHRRRYVVDALRAMGLDCFEPKGAFYVFPSIQSTQLSSADFCERLLVSKRVAVIPGTAFGAGGEGFVRMSYCHSVANLTEALNRMKDFLAEL